MAEKERSFGNRFHNVVTSPGKLLHTGGALFTDSVNTVTLAVSDLASSLRTTAKECADCLSYDLKWYQKALNVPVIIGKGLVGTVKAAVDTVVNTATRAGETVLNLGTNTRKSTFGSIFSAKKQSDVSFNTLKTKKKGEIKIDTSKFVLDPNKSWTPNRGTWSKYKKKKVAKTAAAAGAATTTAAGAATIAAAGEKEIADLKKNFENQMNAKVNEMEAKVGEMKSKFQQQLDEALKINKDLADKNNALSEDNKNKDSEIAKLREEIQGLKKNNEKPVEIKPEKKEEKPVEVKSEKKEEKPVEAKPEKKEEKPVEAKPEKKEEKKEEKKNEGKEGKGADRLSEYIESDKGHSIVNYLKKEHPDMVVKFNKTKDTGHIHLGDSSEELRIGTKNAEEVPTIILHEGAHALIHDEVEGIDELLEYVNDLNEKYGKQLFSISNKTKGVKSEEDVCELIALYARDDGSFDRHMKKLQDGKNENLAQLSESEVEELRDLCENLILNLD